MIRKNQSKINESAIKDSLILQRKGAEKFPAPSIRQIPAKLRSAL
jgi:hypothetical protein